MPEYMGQKITRAQQSARIAYRKALSKAVRVVVKGSGWRSAEGCLFQERAGWFVSASPAVHIYEEVTRASLSAKPMSIDPIFWEITGLCDNLRAPLSLRFNGAWVCRAPDFAEVDVAEQSDVDATAANLLTIANAQLERVVASWTTETFLSLCIEMRDSGAGYLSCLVTTLVAMGREEEALAMCEEAIAKHDMGGFLAPNGTFSEMARDWLRARILARTVN